MTMLSVFIVVLMPVWTTLVNDIPATQRAANTHRQLAGALQRMQQDMDQAIDLPAGDEGEKAGPEGTAGQTLSIRTAEGTIVYQWAGGVLTRSDPGGRAAPHTWQMPEGVIRWRRLGDPAVAGIEVRTAVQVRIGWRQAEKLADTSVFYVGGLGPDAAGEKQP
jgi:hypothetical protein